MSKTSGGTIFFLYTFRFSDGSEKKFRIDLDKKTLAAVIPERNDPPEWAQLEIEQCPNCPLSAATHSHCPIALNLSGLIESFGSSSSFEQVDLEVETPKRTYHIKAPLQRGLSSLIGIYMVSAGCPVMDKLRPMVRHHLPVATMEETQYRAISMYLMAQFLIERKGGVPDWKIKDLVKIYDDIQILNRSFVNRLKQAISKDASLNALVILNNFADFVPFSIDQNILDELEVIFQAYLD